MVWLLPGGRGRICRARQPSIVGITDLELHYGYGLNNQGRESSRRRCTSYGKASEVQRLPYGVVIWQQDLSQ
jgi:hypothetical protein